MKILLTAINAKFIHSSLAIRSIVAFSRQLHKNLSQVEYTINNSSDYILTDIFSQKADIICFSCYIWNIELIINLAKTLKKVLPNTLIICGGPEVSYESQEFLAANPDIDIIIRGEGEETFNELAQALLANKDISTVSGISYRKNSEVFSTPPRAPLDMDSLPFVYENLENLENRIIYYETQRGCPFNCQFCLSSVEKGVRFLPIEKVYTQLDFFLNNNVPQVKFVDRTFNCNKTHAMSIWKYLIENDNGITNFHMEIEAHLVDDHVLALLKTARRGLFQFEIGIQSTNPQTLKAVNRNVDFSNLKQCIIKIQNLGNIHVHLDLIAGLPLEDYASFANSFNQVFALNPQQLQLGFLKVLKGSGLKVNRETYGIEYRHNAPYEVLFTNHLTFDQMLRLKFVEEMLELFYNSGKTIKTINYALQFFTSPFAFFESLGDYWVENSLHKVNHTKAQLYNIFYGFAEKNSTISSHLDAISAYLKFDMLLCDNLPSLPTWACGDKTIEELKAVRREFFNTQENIEKYIPSLLGYTPSQLSRMCRLEFFHHNVLGAEEKEIFILFNYYQRDYFFNQAEHTLIEVHK